MLTLLGMKEMNVNFGELQNTELPKIISAAVKAERKIAVLVDENSLKHCFPKLMHACPNLDKAELIEIESGERNKTIEICTGIWEALAELNFNRNDLFISLGGGVVCDMGGFIAACYKRGMPFYHIPTTLLAQVDASIGGKCGVDLGVMKNLVGVIENANGVYIDPTFIKTLPKDELFAGLAEMLKHGLIYDKAYWDKMAKMEFNRLADFEDLIFRSIEIKSEIVKKDPKEKRERKALNFGHTIGHAIESFSHENPGKSLLHGEAIAIGMLCEAKISMDRGLLSPVAFGSICDLVLKFYPSYVFSAVADHRLFELMKKDKKNENKEVNLTLLDGIGKYKVNQSISFEEFSDVMNFYRSLVADEEE